MTFARKIFLAVFASTLLVGTLLIWAAYRYTVVRSEKEFVSRYQVLTKVLADTLSRLDANTEALMLNAAKMVAEKDAKYGLLSTDELRDLQSELGITHLFVIDKNGRFLRSTNDDPKGIPNLFSFCERYRDLITGDLKVEATPIIKPNPEPKPFKFLSIPNHDRSRIIEVGIRVDFIAKTLTEAIRSDRNVEAMSLFAPDGTPFGMFSEQNVVFEQKKGDLPSSFDEPSMSAGFGHFYTKVMSSHPRCCQCDLSGTSKNGDYYYVLENKVSKSELQAMQANAGVLSVLVGLGNALVSWVLAQFLSRRLVRNIEMAVRRVREIKKGGDVSERISLRASGEISFLTQEFDHLLDTLEDSHNKLIEAEKIQSQVDLARVVAHNIRSPAIAIEMALPGLIMVPEKLRGVLVNAVKEIKDLSSKLSIQADDLIVNSRISSLKEFVHLKALLESVVRQKEVEFSDRRNVKITLRAPVGDANYLVFANGNELRAVLSNVINNAAEAYGEIRGLIEVDLLVHEKIKIVRIRDSGPGIPAEIISRLGREKFSSKGGREGGLGLFHAFRAIESWGGTLSIESKVNEFTCVTIELPGKAEKNLVVDLLD
jgi:signal transduction histidine kinase